MSMTNMKRELDLVTHAIHAVFVYAACTEDGFVKVGISRTPYDRIYQVHCGSPSPVKAAQWVWVGSLKKGREIERRIRKEWDARHCRGEWYRFDYSKGEDKRDFHDTLGAVVEVVTGVAPEWNRLGPAKVAELIKAGNQVAEEKQKPRRIA
ncbi:GIY-YIG nuclease family protein [Stenotrophomonas forensis]|uniref:GIY-YIG nuclease family protein n=1 Tax=Stenotrophomonas forensis TaxID=2871169 RepID=UPI0039C65220